MVHNLPIEECEDGVTSIQFEIPADGIIDDIKKNISERLTNERFYLSRSFPSPAPRCTSAFVQTAEKLGTIRGVYLSMVGVKYAGS